jgi:hypothetical protein
VYQNWGFGDEPSGNRAREQRYNIDYFFVNPLVIFWTQILKFLW